MERRSAIRIIIGRKGVEIPIACFFQNPFSITTSKIFFTVVTVTFDHVCTQCWAKNGKIVRDQKNLKSPGKKTREIK